MSAVNHKQPNICVIFSPKVQEPPCGPGPHYRCFTFTLRHTTLGRTPLDES